MVAQILFSKPTSYGPVAVSLFFHVSRTVLLYTLPLRRVFRGEQWGRAIQESPITVNRRGSGKGGNGANIVMISPRSRLLIQLTPSLRFLLLLRSWAPKPREHLLRSSTRSVPMTLVLYIHIVRMNFSWNCVYAVADESAIIWRTLPYVEREALYLLVGLSV